MIYFALARELNALKIGVTNDIWRRLDLLQTGCPVKLEMIAAEDGGKDREAELHQQFMLLRRRGEWFDYAPTLRAYVSTLQPIEQKPGRKPLGGKLGAWLSDNGLSPKAFAAETGVSYVTIYRVCAGANLPSYDLMERIAHATNGAVLPNDWFPNLPVPAAAEAA